MSCRCELPMPSRTAGKRQCSLWVPICEEGRKAGLTVDLIAEPDVASLYAHPDEAFMRPADNFAKPAQHRDVNIAVGQKRICRRSTPPRWRL
jgi:hypothetical protein